MDDIYMHSFLAWFIGREVIYDLEPEELLEVALTKNLHLRMKVEVYNRTVEMNSLTPGPDSEYRQYGFPRRNIIDFLCFEGYPTVFSLLMSSSRHRRSCYFFSVRPFKSAPEMEIDLFRRVKKEKIGISRYPVLKEPQTAVTMIQSAFAYNSDEEEDDTFQFNNFPVVDAHSPHQHLSGPVHALRQNPNHASISSFAHLHPSTSANKSNSSFFKLPNHKKFYRTSSYSTVPRHVLPPNPFAQSLQVQKEKGPTLGDFDLDDSRFKEPQVPKFTSPRLIKRVGSLFRRAQPSEQESAEATLTPLPNATGGSDRCPTTRTGRFHSNLKRQTTIDSGLLQKENIAPHSMPVTASEDQKVDLEKLLKSETARAPFQNFLQQQFCNENLNFYLAVEDYKVIKDESKRREFGRQIYERHFTPNSVEPVNIDNATSKGIVECIQSGNYSEDMYDVAQYQIFHLLKYDCWPRYLNSGGKAPGPKEFGQKKDAPCINSGKKGSGALSARSTYSAQTSTCSEKREKRKSFFRFLRRNKDASQDQGSELGTSTTPTEPEEGITEPYVGSVNELNLSLSPAATKRRMTRERSVPAPTSRSVGSNSANEPYSPQEDTKTGIRKTRPLSSREHWPTNSAQSTSKSTQCEVPDVEQIPLARESANKQNTVNMSILNDEKEPCSPSSNSATMGSVRTFDGTNGSTYYSSNTTTGTLTKTSEDSLTRLPPLYSSAVRSDKETLTPSESFHEHGFKWQKADYV